MVNSFKRLEMIKKYWALILLSGILMLTFLAYSNVLNGEFQFDDIHTVEDNSNIKYIENIFRKNMWLSYLSGGRPVTDLTFALNYRFGGLDVRWYHITNFLIHIFNGILIFYLVLLTMRSPKLPASDSNRALFVALVSAAIFLLHPIQTEAVSYISQRYESLASLFYLCSLIAYIKARHVSSWLIAHSNNEQRTTNNELRTLHAKRYTLYAISIISGILAIGSKEIAITIPFIILLYDFYFLEDGPLLKRIAAPGIFIVLSVIIGMFMIAHGGRDAGFSVKAFTPWEYLMTQFRVLTTYIRLLFLPINQNLDYDFRVSKSLFEAGTALSFIFLLFLIIIAIASFKKWRLGSFFILWFFIILAPTSSIIPIIDPIFEHRVYLASAGIFIAVIDAFFKCGIYSFIEKIFYSVRIIIIAITLIVLLSLSVATFYRNKVWQTGFALWGDVVKKSPERARGYNNLGRYCALLGRHSEAVGQYKKAIALDKYYIETYYNIALSLEKIGLFKEARYFYEYFYKFAPPEHMEQKRYSLGRIAELEKVINQFSNSSR